MAVHCMFPACSRKIGLGDNLSGYGGPGPWSSSVESPARPVMRVVVEMDQGRTGDRTGDLHAVVAGDTGQGDVAVGEDQSVEARLETQGLQIARLTGEVSYLRRRVAIVERVLSGFQGAVAVLDADPEAQALEEEGSGSS